MPRNAAASCYYAGMPTSLIKHCASVRQGAYLPHWTLEESIYSVTFRLVDAVPQPVLNAWKAERSAMLVEALARTGGLLAEQHRRIDDLFSEKIERYLDVGCGSCWLVQPAIAEMVGGALRYFDRARYDLFAWSVMPNHVHAILRPRGDQKLSGIIHSWKSYTAKLANSVLQRTGHFWQAEYYDHLIRDENELKAQIRYVLENPEKAGLRDWRWAGSMVDLGWMPKKDGAAVGNSMGR